MLLLIDYDNVDIRERSLGIEHIIRKSLNLSNWNLVSGERGRARLYGGWYEDGSLTRRAQVLLAEIGRVSPINIPVGAGSALIDVELANSILADPSTLIQNTFRVRQPQRNLKSRPLPWTACVAPASCPIVPLMHFIDGRSCSTPGCVVTPESVMLRDEQKVVDSMMVADLAFASKSKGRLALVSRDDDMWPGLRLATLEGAKVAHIATSAAPMPSYYGALSGSNYYLARWA